MNAQTDRVGVLEHAPAAGMPPATAQTDRRMPRLVWLGRSLSSLLVFSALVGLAFWGHQTGWKMPTFASLVGEDPPEKQDWCVQHNVPDSQCVECKVDLLPRPKSHGWCHKHGVHECPLCHPEIAQLSVRPQVSPDDLARAKRALTFAERPKNNSKCKLYQRRIQFVSTAAVDKAGIEVDPVWQAPMVEAVAANGEVGYDQTRVARLSTRLPGTIWRVEKQAGDRVRPGEILALVETSEVGKAKAEFLHAFVQARLRARNWDSYQRASVSGAVPDRQLREAETALSEARIRLATAEQALTNLGLPVESESLASVPENQLAGRLHFLGLPDSLVTRLDPKHTTSNLLPLKATFDGVVVAREVVAGEVVDTAKVLFVVADPSQVWLTLDVRVEDAKDVTLGLSVRFRPDGSKTDVNGQITWSGRQAQNKETGQPSEVGQKKRDHSRWWCEEHGIPEAECSMCNAKVAAAFKKKGDWCEKHDRAKSQCFICDPSLKEKYAAKYRAKYGKEPPPIEEEMDDKKGETNADNK